MKRVPKPVFFIVALLILVFASTAIFGVSYYNGDNKVTVIKGVNDIRWGIDIRGGVEATFKPAGDIDATETDLDSAKTIIETRMVSQGITDYELYADYGTDRIIVRFPWKEDETSYDPKEAIDEISAGRGRVGGRFGAYRYQTYFEYGRYRAFPGIPDGYGAVGYRSLWG